MNLGGNFNFKRSEPYPVREVRDLRELLSGSAELYKDAPAYLYKRKVGGEYLPIAFTSVKSDVESLGTAFVEQGFKDRNIAIIGENRYEWVISYLAIVCGLGVVVPLDKELPPHEIAALIDRAEISVIIFSSKVEQKIREALEISQSKVALVSMDNDEDYMDTLSLKKMVGTGRRLIARGDRGYISLPIDADRMHIILFTSGTTGLAKGVMLSHGNIISNIYRMSEYVDVSARDNRQQVGLSFLPMHHTYEFTCNILTSLYQGATVAFSEGLKYIVKNLSEAEVNHIVAVPLVFENIHKKIWKQAAKSGKADKMKAAIKMITTLSRVNKKIPKRTARHFKEVHAALGGHVRMMISGAAAIDPQVIKDFNAMGITMFQGYGMTECSPIIALNPDYAIKPESVGKALPGSEIRIDSPDEEGIGEILCRSESVMLGYYKDEEATANTIVDGWLYTGDYGYMDRDGYLYISGRKKNVIVTKNGKNIYPEEVEFYLLKSPYIAEVVVRGEYNSGGSDLAVTAEIFPDFEAIEEELGDISQERLQNLIKDEVEKYNEKMPLYKRIRRVSLRESEFEKTTTRKIKRW